MSSYAESPAESIQTKPIKVAILRILLYLIIPPYAMQADVLCGRWDTLDVLDGEYRINNCIWGEGPGVGEQCISAYPNSTYFSVIYSTHNSSSVSSYPFILKGCHWGHCTDYSGMPIRVSGVGKAPFSWSIDPNGAGGKWNAAYESFFSLTGGTEPNAAELMVWINYNGDPTPTIPVVGTVNIGGYTWDVYHLSPVPWGKWDHFIVYMITSPVNNVSLDFKDFIDDSVGRGYIDPDWYMDNMEAGFEIWADGNGLTSNSFSASVNPPIYVDANAVGACDGSSWTDAHNFLQDGLAEAGYGTIIMVANGVYKPDRSSADPNGSGDRTATFQLINGVVLRGGYAGFGEPDPNARDIELYETILSGDLNGDDVGFINNGENSYHVVTASEIDETAVLDGFTITAGNANGPAPHNKNKGGGMYNKQGNIMLLSNCTFSGNSAIKGAGGGIYNYYNSPLLINCTFSGNSAINGAGGGMFNEYSSPELVNCTCSGNSADEVSGGMYNFNSSPMLTNCILWGNSDSGGIDESAQISGGTPVINYCCVQGWTGGLGGTGNIGDDPLFVDAKGPDGIAGTQDDNLRLSMGSNCIDAGDNNSVPFDTADLDGGPRFIDGDCNDTEIVDMGAYEFSYAYIGDFDYDCDVDFGDFATLGLAWLSQPGDGEWNRFCDISIPADNYVDCGDLDVLTDDWLFGK